VLCMLHHVVLLLEDILITEIVTIFQKSLHDHNTGSRQLNKKFDQSSFPKEGKEVLCTAQKVPLCSC
jgi:hypothetical protein